MWFQQTDDFTRLTITSIINLASDTNITFNTNSTITTVDIIINTASTTSISSSTSVLLQQKWRQWYHKGVLTKRIKIMATAMSRTTMAD